MFLHPIMKNYDFPERVFSYWIILIIYEYLPAFL